jgi:hypothetical protein
MKQLPFNLKKALAGEPTFTKDGLEVKDIVFFKSSSSIYRLHGVLNESIREWMENGKYISCHDSDKDLCHHAKTTVVKGWVNVYRDGNIGDIYDTEIEAKEGCSKVKEAAKQVYIEVEFED